MPKDKERTLNPAAAQRKADKARALKKSKAAVTTQRNERLARRNPHQLERQIEELKNAESTGGQLKPHEKQRLEGLERELQAVQKARKAMGDKAPQFGRGSRGNNDTSGQGGILGKRRRDEQQNRRRGRSPSSSDTDSEARTIPMPRDTPPPITRRRGPNHPGTMPGEQDATNRTPHALPTKPTAPAQTVYSAAPMVRDLQKEATTKFMPSTVARKIAGVKGQGGRLLEPEELDKLENEGYKNRAEQDEQRVTEGAETEATRQTLAAEANGDLEEEERRFQREIMNVEMDDGKDQAMHAAGRLADEMEAEATHAMMAEEARLKAGGLAGDELSKAEQTSFDQVARKVEIEEVEDEDL